MRAIREFGKFVPAFAAFETNRLSLYREAAMEAEEIFDRWADEIDDLDEDFICLLYTSYHLTAFPSLPGEAGRP